LSVTALIREGDKGNQLWRKGKNGARATDCGTEMKYPGESP